MAFTTGAGDPWVIQSIDWPALVCLPSMLRRPSTLNPSFLRLPGRSLRPLPMVYRRLSHYIYTASPHYNVSDTLKQTVDGTVSQCENVAVTGLPKKLKISLKYHFLPRALYVPPFL